MLWITCVPHDQITNMCLIRWVVALIGSCCGAQNPNEHPEAAHLTK